MNEEYVRDSEFRTYYPKLGGLRFRIAADLPVGPGMRILDVATQPSEKVWAKFGKQIEEHGLGHYSKVVLMIAQKFDPDGLSLQRKAL